MESVSNPTLPNSIERDSDESASLIIERDFQE